MTTSIGRRGALALGAGILARPALAQGRYPDRPIRILVPWTPGGSTDVLLRALGDGLSKRYGQPVVLENRPGAGGILGAQVLASNTRPDGYTLSQMPVSVFRYPQMVARPPFDPMADFTWVAQLTGYLFGVVVRADAPWQTFQDLLADAKANPGRINYGTPGAGTSLHITMEQIAAARGIEWTHVPYRGSSENLASLLGGTIQVSAESSSWAEMVAAGRLRLLCTWAAERTTRFPDVPTLRETGTDIVSTSPYGIAGPAGMDPAVVRMLEEGCREILADPAYVALMARYDMSPAFLGSADYARAARAQFREDGEMIRRLNLRAS